MSKSSLALGVAALAASFKRRYRKLAALIRN